MVFLAAGLVLILLSGAGALCVRSGKIAARLGSAGVIAGSILAIIASVNVLVTGASISLKIPWQVPYGSFSIELDGLSALFLIPMLIISSAASLYACGYLEAYKDRRLGVPVFFFNVLVTGMAMVLLARNGVLFLTAWEIMSLASYFLVTFRHEHESVRQAGWTYIIATHIGTAFLLAMFVMMGKLCGSLDFEDFGALKHAAPGVASCIFLFATAGFGTKAGIMPLHVWLPEAHPAAPSHVSAVMSAVMIKTGVYGVIRIITLMPEAQAWWGLMLIGIGIVSAVLGILFALAQHDIKRMLAYSSVENIGIIFIGLGLGVTGMAQHSVILIIFGFAGALLHAINHAMFKGLLFLGAGAVVHATGTRHIDMMGGIIKRMPQTAWTFIIGAMAICALPPLNGFAGEFLLYYGSLKALLAGGIRSVAPAATAIGAIALTGGLALACFTKLLGIMFLGEPRSTAAAGAHEAALSMRMAMWILAGLCVISGIAAPAVFVTVSNVLTGFLPANQEAIWGHVQQSITVLVMILAGFAAIIIISALLWKIRGALLKGRIAASGPTWDCGYARAVPRIQYTGSSFTRPIVSMFKSVLGSRRKAAAIKDIFPQQAAFESSTPDVSSEYIYRPTFKWIDWAMGKMRWVQYGTVQLYVLYIALTLIILLIWKLR